MGETEEQEYVKRAEEAAKQVLEPLSTDWTPDAREVVYIVSVSISPIWSRPPDNDDELKEELVLAKRMRELAEVWRKRIIESLGGQDYANNSK